MSIVDDHGAVQRLAVGHSLYVTWYHPPSPFRRTENGLFMAIDSTETYYGTSALCHKSIKTDHLKAGSDFCLRMITCRCDEAESGMIACAVEGPDGLDKVRRHVFSENHVYGCDTAPGQSIFLPASMLSKRKTHDIRPGRRYNLAASPIAQVRVVVSQNCKTAAFAGPVSEDAVREEGPLPKYIGRLQIGGQIYAGYALRVA